MSILMIILSIIGAIPEILTLVQQILDWIKQIDNLKTRRVLRSRLSRLVVSHLTADHKQVKDSASFVLDLQGMKSDVLAIRRVDLHDQLCRVNEAAAAK